jgi:ribosome recycling factor
MIRLPVPELTEDRRKDMVKLARKMAEDGRIAIRNIRRDAITDIKNGDETEDEVRRAETDVQKVTDEFIAAIDTALKGKEAEIMEV